MKAKIGISSCLLGNKVRWNGGHELDEWISTRLSRHVDFVPFCPEVEMGLGVPRDTLRLQKNKKSMEIKLLFNKNLLDVSELAHQTALKLIKNLPDLDGVIFKGKSPSCGAMGVKIYSEEHGIPDQLGTGIFYNHFKMAFPYLPSIDDGRLHNTKLRQEFLIHFFTLKRYKIEVFKMKELVQFHSRHKYLFMCYSNTLLQSMGRIVANHKQLDFAQVYLDYFLEMANLFKLPMKDGLVVNSLTHIYGHFKNKLKTPEKKYILQMIEDFKKGIQHRTPLLSLFNFLAHQYGEDYILHQQLLLPYPLDLA